MTFSMTGYGYAQQTFLPWFVAIEMKSVNHRNLDLKLSRPDSLMKLDYIVEKMIRKQIGRGRVHINVSITHQSNDEFPGFNVDLYRQRQEVMAQLFPKWTKEKLQLQVLQTPDLWRVEPAIDMQTVPVESVMGVIQLATERLNATRQQEGKQLAIDLLDAIDHLDALKEKATERAPIRIAEYSDRFQERIEQLQQNLELEIDPQRVAYELAIIADKADIREELTRIGTHLSALRILINDETDPLTCNGKRIDFYLQELRREVTTIASKSRDTLLTKYSIDMRTIIESMREQTANIQ